MSNLSGRLLGFDIRRQPEDYLGLWKKSRRDLYLLQPEIEEIFSVDRFVWPSLFSFPPAVTGVVSPDFLATIPGVPEYAESGIWFNRNEMRACHNRAAAQAKGGIEIAVELVADPDLDSSQFGSALLEKDVIPSRLPHESSELGYDVADAGMTSGLSNCSYLADEKKNLVAQWSKKLNQYGLLRSLDDAMVFKTVSDQRVADHAPFWVFRLYRLF